MLIDQYDPEDVFARVPELADQTDPVLVQLDRLLDDDHLYQYVRHDLAHRHRLTLVHGRHSTPAEVILRLLVVQHLYAWSYQETVERVADSLVLRWFVRVYFQRVPDKTTLLRWAHTMQPQTLQALIDRIGRLARHAHVTTARKLRVDGTCVQTTIHHPTDSGLLGDGVRVLSRLLRRAKPLVAEQVAKVRGGRLAFRSHLRTVRWLLQQVHRVRRQTGEEAAEQQRGWYRRLLDVTRQTVRQAHRVVAALTTDTPAGDRDARRQRHVQRLHAEFARVLPLVERVIAQAQSRVLDGVQVPSPQKVLSLFEPHTRVVKRHKLGAAVEFGRQVVFDEIDGGFVTRFQVLADGESERRQALPAVRHHQAVFGRAPRLLTGDRGLHTKGVEATAQALGVRHVVIPRSGPTTAAQRAREHDPRWRRRYRWRAGIEGRIHSLRRDYGLARVRSHGAVGLERDIGWGIVASDLRHLALAQVQHQRPSSQRVA